jgi:hypothetical protein
MPLSLDLRDIPIEFRCPICSHPTARKGSWLITIGRFKCEGCRATVRIGYEEKIAIFERHRINRDPQQRSGSTKISSTWLNGGAMRRGIQQAEPEGRVLPKRPGNIRDH